MVLCFKKINYRSKEFDPFSQSLFLQPKPIFPVQRKGKENNRERMG
jgi:hypothetical protein